MGGFTGLLGFPCAGPGVRGVHLWRPGAIKHVGAGALGHPFLATEKSAFLCLLSTATPSATASATMAVDCDTPSRPSTPPNSIPLGYFPATFERFVRENEMADWASAFTLFGACCPMPDMMRVCWG